MSTAQVNPTHGLRETIRPSCGWVRIGGQWHEEVAKRLLGTVVLEVQIRDGRWFDIAQVEQRS